MNERICEIEGCNKLGKKGRLDYREPRCNRCSRLTRLGLLPKPNRYPPSQVIKTLSIRQQANRNKRINEEKNVSLAPVTDSSNAV